MSIMTSHLKENKDHPQANSPDAPQKIFASSEKVHHGANSQAPDWQLYVLKIQLRDEA